jgi:D-alanyl-D-alanine carboxypeptidase/D-alanyl-D-alanine-endopeptidase (penicillin-binding protein 4)
LPSLLTVANAAFSDWHALATLQQSGARVSAAAVDLSDNAVIQQLNADVRLTPASLTKLAVAAAALSVWPADKMFKTQLLAAGTVDEGRLAGDLYLVGAGDPSLTGESLLSLAAQVKSAGTGDRKAIRHSVAVRDRPLRNEGSVRGRYA